MILFPIFAGNWCTAAAHFSILPSSFLALSFTTEGSFSFPRVGFLGSLFFPPLSLSLSLSRPFSEHQEKGEEQTLGVQCVQIETNIRAFSRTYNDRRAKFVCLWFVFITAASFILFVSEE